MKRTILNALITLAAFSSSALADSGGAETGGLMTKLFLAFLAMIIVCQLVPGLVLFGSMLKGLFAREPRETALLKKGGKSV